MQDLSVIRERINRIDTQISELFLERMDAAADVAEYKRATGKPVFDRARERENIVRASERVPENLASYAAVLESLLMEASREAQYRRLGLKSAASLDVTAALDNQPHLFPQQAYVACQGVEGAYQQIACDRMFKRAQISYFNTFDGVFRAVDQGFCQFGVLPIENSTAGSVNRVYDLMMSYDFYIVRTCRLKIDHNLLVNPGTKLEDVRIVYSHEQAINQCANYLSNMPNARVHVCENTAIASQRVAESGEHTVAAIASRDCAALYGLEIAGQSIQDQQNNYTRFACIAKDLTTYPGADRTSLMAVLPHEPGSLYKVLGRLYALGINLLKLESRPIPDRDFEFMFYFDVACPATAPEFQTLLNSLSDVCDELRYLGSYSEVI
ncbi:MAG: prephenate dehydratase domain-containing protein [Coriobacteriales bacterium]|nr:prephenate dehydratase domain-containing protein [Coriobacteriales bacterium]